MAKEKAQPAGAPAWMVTFADLMSLLVCFFVLIISFSIQDEQKLQVVAGSVRDAFGVSRDWQAKALVEIDGRPKTKNVQLPPHQTVVVFMPRPEQPPPEDVPEEEDADADPTPVAARSQQGDAGEELLSSAADFLELSDHSADSLHAHVGDPGAEGGDGDPGAQGLAADWREAYRQEQVAAAEERFVDDVKQSVAKLAAQRPELARLARNLQVERAEDGVRIQLIDDVSQPMFALGSSNIAETIRPLLREVATLVAGTENQVLITGHTDSRPFRGKGGYDNWNLSSDRAHATRKALVAAGVPPNRIAGVLGKGDSEHIVSADPLDPRNRRIGILLLRDGA